MNWPRPFAASTQAFVPLIQRWQPRPGARKKIRSATASAQFCNAPAMAARSAEIAAELRLSEGTVRNYLSEAIAKLGAANRVDAARIARARGWL